MNYLSRLNRDSYEFAISEGNGAVPRKPAFPSRDDERTKMSIDAFLKVLDKADDLCCLVEEASSDGGHKVVLKHIITEQTAKLSIIYSGKEYFAKVALGECTQLSVQEGPEKAAERIVSHLEGKCDSKIYKQRKSPETIFGGALKVNMEPGRYDHLTEDF